MSHNCPQLLLLDHLIQSTVVTYEAVNKLAFSQECNNVLNYSYVVAQKCNHDYRDTYHLLAAILVSSKVGRAIAENVVGLEDVSAAIWKYQPPREYESYLGSHRVSKDLVTAVAEAEILALQQNLSSVKSRLLCVSLLLPKRIEETELLETLHVQIERAMADCQEG